MLELAPLVFEAEADADGVAAGIVDRLADEVVALARAALTRLELTQEPVEVVLGGGLLKSAHGRILDAIAAGLADVGPHVRVHPTASAPVVGAALLGLDELGATAEAQERAREEITAAVERVQPAAPSIPLVVPRSPSDG